MKRFALIFSLLPIAASGPLAAYAGESVAIVADPARPAAVFEGIGAVSAGASSRLLIDYPEPARSRILDYLFKPKYGAGFQHLKVEVGGDINSTDGTEPSHMRRRDEENYQRGYEWWLMKEAKARNPRIILDCLAWGAPGWVGNGKFASQDMADYYVNFIRGAKNEHGLDIELVGIWNERAYEAGWIKLLRRTLDAAGLQRVGIVAHDGVRDQGWRIAELMAADAELARSIHAIGDHYPRNATPKAALDFQKAGKRLWSSEDGEWQWKTFESHQNRLRAQTCNRNWVDRRLTKTEFWSPVTAYYDCLPAPGSGVIVANTPWSGAFTILPALWAVAHTTQFAEPGWSYLEGACRTLPKGGSVVGFASPDRRDLSIVIETIDAGENQQLSLKLPGAPVAALHVWRSDARVQFVRDADLKPVDGTFTLTAAPNAVYSLTTTTGQRRGGAASPPPAPFPSPYRDNFDAYPPGATPRYLSDIGGAFEIAGRTDGKGRCLRQVIERRGIYWAPVPAHFTILGDAGWEDMEISVDAAFESVPGNAAARAARYVAVLACYDSGGGFRGYGLPFPPAYSLRLHADGTWKLLTPTAELARGVVTEPGTAWHRLSLRRTGRRLAAAIDGAPVAEVGDDTFHHGLWGIGSGMHTARFDNLEVLRLDPSN